MKKETVIIHSVRCVEEREKEKTRWSRPRSKSNQIKSNQIHLTENSSDPTTTAATIVKLAETEFESAGTVPGQEWRSSKE